VPDLYAYQFGDSGTRVIGSSSLDYLRFDTGGAERFRIADAGVTLPTGEFLKLGTTQWNSGDSIDGTKVANADLGDIGVSSGVWTVENAAVIGKLITGFTSGAGALAGTDTILQAINKLDGNVGTKQAADADLTTYAGITPSANAQTLLAETFAQMQASLSIDDLITLSGVAEGSVNLATFTGTTIADNVTMKAALQALETAVEGKQATVTEGSLADSTIVSADIKDGTVTYTDMVANLPGFPHHWHISIVNPNAVVTASAVIPICTLTDAALTITKIVVSTSSASYEAAGDVKFADARIGLGTATVVETFDTTSGVRSDTSMSGDATVPSGKFVYLSFDSAPNALMTDMVVDVYFDYD
jgi:hypothetical protein